MGNEALLEIYEETRCRQLTFVWRDLFDLQAAWINQQTRGE